MDKTTKAALKLADATLAALAAGDDYYEAMNEYDMTVNPTKKQLRTLEAAERKFKRLAHKGYVLAVAMKAVAA